MSCNAFIGFEDILRFPCSIAQDANGRDLSQFERWYLQAGTPTVTATDAWDAETGTYSLTLKQTVPDTPGQMDKLPMQIPVRVPWPLNTIEHY